MGSTLWRGLLFSIVLAGCAQLAPAPRDLQAKRFEALPDKAVIYLVRDIPALNERPATLWLGNAIVITTYPGTYYRWEVPAGVHRITGHELDFGTITLETEAGKVYYVEQQVSERYVVSYFYRLDEQNGRAAVMRAALLAGS